MNSKIESERNIVQLSPQCSASEWPSYSVTIVFSLTSLESHLVILPTPWRPLNTYIILNRGFPSVRTTNQRRPDDCLSLSSSCAVVQTHQFSSTSFGTWAALPVAADVASWATLMVWFSPVSSWTFLIEGTQRSRSVELAYWIHLLPLLWRFICRDLGSCDKGLCFSLLYNRARNNMIREVWP